jgi:type IV pilus assembly protein PilM
MSLLDKKIFNSGGDVFGLDLSDLSAKVVYIEKSRNIEKVSSFSSVQMPLGCISDGEILKKDVVVSIIKKAVESAGPKKIKTKKVICSLPETKAFLRIISIPQMGQDEIKEAVKWEMEANIPLSVDQVYYDWQVLTDFQVGEKNKLNLLVVAIAKNTVDQVMEVLSLAGLDTVGLEIESVAQARSLLNEKKDKETALIVDIGDRRTSFSISEGGIPCFTSSIPLSGQSLTDAISKGMGVAFEEAEKIKFENGIGSDFKNDMLFKFASPILENLVSEINRSIDFYVSGLKYSDNVDRIVLCGGGANTKGILPFISKKIGREVELGNPWTNMNMGKDIPLIPHDKAVQYSTAIGLALKGLHYEDLY